VSAGWVAARDAGEGGELLVQEGRVERNSEIRKIEDVQPLPRTGSRMRAGPTVK